MGAALNFDATDIPPTSPFAPVPAGTYRAHVIESEVKSTANGQGKYLQLTWEVLDGEFKGRKVWQRLNIVNPNATAQEIAQRELSAICHATGTLKLTNSAMLHHKPALLKVTVRQSDHYDPQNEVKSVTAVDGTKAAATPASAAPAPAAANADAPAWARKTT